MRLAGKVAVVTGAGQGMGRAIAQRFADEGATVVALDLNEESAKQTLEGKGGKHIARSVNVADSAAVNQLFADIKKDLGAVDVLVNNAGTGGVDQFADITDEAWARVIGVNLNGAFYCARAAVKQMQEGQGGAIVNISSTSAVSGDGPAHYCASKAALMGLTRGMAKELAAKKIRVNTLVPGFFPAEQNKKVLVPERIAKIMNHTPMNRFGEAKELVGAALLLASNAAGSFITGHEMVVDGGYSSLTI